MELESKKSSGITATTANGNTFSLFELFISGFLFDKDCNYSEIPKDIIYVIATSTHMKFNYEYDFDQKGVLSFLRNVDLKFIDRKNIIINFRHEIYSYHRTTSFASAVNRGDTISLLGNSINYYLLSVGDLYIDLQQFRLRISQLTFILNRYGAGLSFMCRVGFQGSNDLILWEPIDKFEEERKENNNKVEIVSYYKSKTWNFQNKTNSKFFRYFKIPSSKSFEHELYATRLSGIEMYGNLITDSNQSLNSLSNLPR
jgi:hypothetical protein